MADDIKNRVSAAVRSARTKIGLSQAELAEKVDVSMEAISHIERGASVPSLETFASLVTVLGLDVNKLMSKVVRRQPASIERARLDAEIEAFADTLTDRDVKRWLELGRVMKQK
jgi:transcriptional regulator with XRE-family HTH domain